MRLCGMRKGITVEVTPADRARLQSIIQDRNSPQKHVWRARIIVLTADGAGTTAITRAVVSAAIGGLPGLRVLSRSRPSTPLSAKRCCQRHTVGRLTPMLCATC